MEVFEWDKIEVKGNRSGEKTTTCPVCSHTRKKKTDKCLSVSFTLGKAFCHHCNAVSFEDDERQSKGVKNYELPRQDWRNYTSLSDSLVKWCETERRITQKTLMEFGVTEEKQFIPQAGKENNCIVFNYFEGNKVVNKKYRDGKKNFTQSKGGKPIFYNLNRIVGSKSIYIVEGEFDVLAMYEAGIKNVVSLPSGANDNDDYWQNSKEYLTEVNDYIIAVDNDDKGKQIRERIAHRLGKYRCKFIEWKGKDANDDLISGDIYDSLKNVQKFPVNGTFNALDFSEQIDQLYNDGIPKTIAPKKRAFGDFYKTFSTLPGQLTVWTGIPSHGKSNFCEWYVLNEIHEYDYKASFFSPEHHPIQMHFANFAQKAVGKPFYTDIDGIGRMTKEDIDRFKLWSKDRLYITAGEGKDVVDWKWLIEKFKEQLFSFGINIFVVDAWNKVQMPKGYFGKEGIDKVLTELTAFCQQNNVSLHLIAHPTKMKKTERGDYEVPTLYDVSGSSDFRNQAHNGCTIYRKFDTAEQEGCTEFYNMKTKMAFQGRIGEKVVFKYHIPTARYYVEGCAPYHLDLTQDGEREPIDYEEPKELGNLNKYADEFEFNNDEDDECPF